MAKNILITKPIILLLMCMMLFVLVSCGGGPSDKDNSDSSPRSVISESPDISESPEIGAIGLSSVSGDTIIETNRSLSIKVELVTKNGELLSGDKSVKFELSNPLAGKIPSPVTISNGQGTVNFRSNNIEECVTIMATTIGAEDAPPGSLYVQIANTLPPATVQISADPNRVSLEGTSHISVQVLDKNGQPVRDGTQVDFNLSSGSYGEITASASTSKGRASGTFVAPSSYVYEEVTVTASAGDISGSVTIAIERAEVGSIAFISADPNAIGVRESGQVEVSQVTFQVRDDNGKPVPSQSVHVTLFGPHGGEYLQKPGLKEMTVSTTEQGYAQVNVHSGIISGPVRLEATTFTSEGIKLSTSSGVVAIGGGKPSESHFSLSASRLNVEGLAFDGIQSEIMARLADRYGNVDVLKGSTVSFYCEGGGIERSVSVNNKGFGQAIFTTLSFGVDPFTQVISPQKTCPWPQEMAFLNELHYYFPEIPAYDPNVPVYDPYAPLYAYSPCYEFSPCYYPNNPACEPYNPLYDPNNPACHKDNPLYNPNDPVCCPCNRCYEPDNPVCDPNNPCYDPNKPVCKPSNPWYDPNNPLCDPNNPCYDLFDASCDPACYPDNHPCYDPSNIACQPTNPLYDPNNPACNPFNPEYNPYIACDPNHPAYTPRYPPYDPAPAYDPNNPDDPNPRDGWCTVIAVVDGEEEFTDSNATGRYEITESFDDTWDDIFIDKDDDYDIDTAFEDLVIDLNKDGSFDACNGKWDRDKKIYKKINLLITGEPRIYTNLPDGFYVPNGDSWKFKVFVGDENYNIPIDGTIVSFSTTTGDISPKSYVFPDRNSLPTGGEIFDCEVMDSDPIHIIRKRAVVTITCTWKGQQMRLKSVGGWVY